MTIDTLLRNLGYAGSRNFLAPADPAFARAPDVGHVFRQAARTCGLRGVYSLRPSAGSQVVPITYVCEVESEAAADALHRRVWNQDIVPFLLVHTPKGLKFYSGFRYRRAPRGGTLGALSALTAFHDADGLVDSLRAEAIDEGRVWKQWGDQVTPQHRVYWRLLDNLRELDRRLQRGRQRLPKESAHALIGKYVYLRYLRDRDILSDRRLAEWRIEAASVFGRRATRRGLRILVERLDEWLNGSIFDLPLSGADAPTEEHIQRVAGTFAGDQPVVASSWQLHLDFPAYDFSHIPIETLSMLYEQFLHAPDKVKATPDNEDEERPKGERTGAYYTPLPVVNFMLTELEERKPVRRGMKVIDPACGSGAFLVQCYRRLIETEFPPDAPRPAPYQLKELLQQSIFGVDVDPDACSVAELSLVLTLLDYVQPPDLENNPRFHLPALRDRNIFAADFFQAQPSVGELLGRRRFDWVVGNPPWKQLKSTALDPEDTHAWAWMRAHQDDAPVGRYQVAQAFAWCCPDLLQDDGECGLLMPAMSLFEDHSTAFRAGFFRRHRVHAVANFSNLAEVLFAGRSRVPAAAVFFANRPQSATPDPEEAVTTFSPLVANQEATRPPGASLREPKATRPGRVRKRSESWSLVITGNEIREIPLREIAAGHSLPWKLATWGSHFDARLLTRMARTWPSLGAVEDTGRLIVSEGPQLRRKPEIPNEEEAEDRRRKEPEAVEEVEELREKHMLDVDSLKRLRHIFSFPKSAIVAVPDDTVVRKRGGVERPLQVCRPPHVIVGESRTFAVYCEDFLVVPARQIGIASPSKDRHLLKALALYLVSDFTFYHQFLSATHFGVQRGLATLAALRQLPLPFADSDSRSVLEWDELHEQLSTQSPRLLRQGAHATPSLLAEGGGDLDDLLRKLNRLTGHALGLTDREQAIVHDLVHVRLALNDGKLGSAAVSAPDRKQLLGYASRLRRELDAFVGRDAGRRHVLAVVHDDLSGMVQVDFTRDRSATGTVVYHADREAAEILVKTRRRLREQNSQWVYFDRNLRIYEGRRTYLFKPMQRFHWTESQAMVDAGEIIAETLGAGRASA